MPSPMDSDTFMEEAKDGQNSRLSVYSVEAANAVRFGCMVVFSKKLRFQI